MKDVVRTNITDHCENGGSIADIDPGIPSTPRDAKNGNTFGNEQFPQIMAILAGHAEN